VLASAVLIGPLVFGVVYLQALVSQSSFRMEEISRQNTQLQQSYGQLKLQVAQLSAPGRIAQQARRMGLQVPDGANVHTLDVPGSSRAEQQSSRAPSAFALKPLLGNQP
jgi:cell division protein FtsL